jgi:hypothetical protein
MPTKIGIHGFLKRLKHPSSLALCGSRIANTPRRKVPHAGIQPIGHHPHRSSSLVPAG